MIVRLSVRSKESAAFINVVVVDYKVDATDLRLSGLEAFTFDYVVKWPVSLVISRKVCLLTSARRYCDQTCLSVR